MSFREYLDETNKPKSVKTDQTGKKCSNCNKGKYQETSNMDDVHGVLHCENCRKEVPRWV